ncbi:serine/arginine repetitive matrix protein 2-like [Schistocerca nitens]|uniref:serine/arginine repetitive matrix protein 2-like n=1 Tax=Schistocerca nitens TaxID=7011 RepID=UPI0021187ED8|nr:serine/arginine repetitive matrix protein 2-like [Schistocerca nitens]
MPGQDTNPADHSSDMNVELDNSWENGRPSSSPSTVNRESDARQETSPSNTTNDNSFQLCQTVQLEDSVDWSHRLPSTSASPLTWQSHTHDEPGPSASASNSTFRNYIYGGSSDSGSESDDTQANCPICFVSLLNREVATPDSCQHYFCCPCLKQWSKTVTTCPVDRRKFKLILVRNNIGGQVIRVDPVDPVSVQSFSDNDDDPTFCQVCHQRDREDRMLLCDYCDSGFHLECLNPPLEAVPDGDWFCSRCQLLDTRNTEQNQGRVTWVRVPTFPVGLGGRRVQCVRVPPVNRQVEEIVSVSSDDELELEVVTRSGRRVRRPSVSSNSDSARTQQKTPAQNGPAEQTSTARKKVTRRAPSPRGEQSFFRTQRQRRRQRQRQRNTSESSAQTVEDSEEEDDDDSTVRKSGRSRLAENLGLAPCRRSQSSSTAHAPAPASSLNRQRVSAGIPTLNLFGNDSLDYFSDGSDGENGNEGGGTSMLCHRSRSSPTTARRLAARKLSQSLMSSTPRPHVNLNPRPSTSRDTTSSSRHNLLDSIMESQGLWHSRNTTMSLRRDGTITIKKASKVERPSKAMSGSDDGQSISRFTESSDGYRERIQHDSNPQELPSHIFNQRDAISVVPVADCGPNIFTSHAGSSGSSNNVGQQTCVNSRFPWESHTSNRVNVTDNQTRVSQVPLYPGNSSNSRSPGSSGSYHHNKDSQYERTSTSSYQYSGHMYSGTHLSGFDSDRGHLGYTGYLGPENSSATSDLPNPGRFNLLPQFPVRRTHPHPSTSLSASSTDERQLEESDFLDDQDISSGKSSNERDTKKNTYRKVTEDDDLDIYSDIEVSSAGGQNCASEHEDNERNFDVLPPPPEPSALLIGLGEQDSSDSETNDSLVIDIRPNPDDHTHKDNVTKSPDESEKYDPAVPCDDSDDDDDDDEPLVSQNLHKEDIPLPPCPPSSEKVDMSTSNASYLQSPTYGELSKQCSVHVTEAVTEAVKEVINSTLQSSSASINKALASGDEDDDEGECPNFSIYSADSMDIARKATEIPEENTGALDKSDPVTVMTDEDKAEVEKCEAKSDILEMPIESSSDHNNQESRDNDEQMEESGSISEVQHEPLENNDDMIEHLSKTLQCSSRSSSSCSSSSSSCCSSSSSSSGSSSSSSTDGSSISQNTSCEEPSKVVTSEEKDTTAIAVEQIADQMSNLSAVHPVTSSASENDEKSAIRDENDPKNHEAVKLDVSGETENLVEGATAAVSAVSPNNATGSQNKTALSLSNTASSPNSSLPAATPVGLEGLDTETISETEEAINFDDDMSHDETSFLSEEDGEISPQKKRKKATDEVNDSSKADNDVSAEKPQLEKDLSPAETVDYEEGEIVDERPRLTDITQKDKILDKDKRLESNEIRSADEAEMSESSVHAGIEEEKKKKKKKSTDRDRDRADLIVNDDDETVKGKGSTLDDSISWKKPSKGTKERNYRDSKSIKPTEKGKDGSRKENEDKELPKKEKKKKEKRKDMERYDVRKIVSDKKRKRKDEFGRDLSRDRSYSRSQSRSKSRGKSRDRSVSLSRSKTNRAKGRSSPRRSRHRSRSRSRSRSYRSRSRSKNKSISKLKDRNRKSRSKERQRKASRDRSRSRNRRSRSRSGSRLRNRSRSRSIHKSREGKDRSRAATRQKRPPKNRRSWSRTWTSSWSRSRSQSVSCSSYSRSPSPSARRYNRSYSRSFSRSWSRERHERVPLLEKKTNPVAKPPKKLTVIVNNSKEDSDRQRKKDKKKKDSRKSKDQSGAEKRKKRKERSPLPSKEVFTSGDNILVSVNFNKSNKGPGAKDAAVAAAAAVTSASICALPKDSSKRKQREDTFDVGRETTKKSRKDKSGKEKTSKALNNAANTDKTLNRRSKKGAKGDKRLAALLRQKPVAIIDLDQSPFREQTPSPRDLIVLSDSDDAQRDKETEMEDGIMTRMMHQEILSPQNSLKMSATARTPESQSPVMSSVGNYLNTSTGPKTPPEPQIKFSIAAKPQLRSISNPLREEDDDLMAEDTVLDESDRQMDEDLDRDIMHKGPNTPPEPRGPTTPCSPPISPDAYDPFDPTKSGTPSPVREEVHIDELQSPSGTPCEEVMQHSVGVTDSPIQSDPDDTAKKTLEMSSEIPLIQSSDNLRDDVTLSPDRTKSLTMIETMLGSSPSNIDESVVGASQHQLQVEVSPSEPGEKSSTLSVTMIVPMNSDITPLSPEIKIIPMTVQQQKLLKQNIVQQPVTSTPTHCSTPSNYSNLPSSIASTPISPLTSTPVSRSNVFSTPITITVPQLSSHHLPHHLPSSPVVSQQRTVGIKTVPEKVTAISYVKSVPQRPTGQQNGDQKEQMQDTSTEVVDMDLDSPYSPGSSEGDDLFEPPSETVKPTAAYPPMNTRASQTPQKNLRQSLPATGNTPNKPPDKFDALFGMSPARNKGSTKMGKIKTHHGKTGKMKGKLGKGSKKEIQIKMDEDQLQILDDLPSSAVELQVKDKFLKKLNRQERVVEEVKLSLKPYYTSKKINKEEYKEILRRSVPKICHNRSGEINPKKISALVDAYVTKYRYLKKKQHGSQRKQSKPSPDSTTPISK